MKKRDYKKLFKIGTIISGIAFFCMTMMFFVLIVYSKDDLVFQINPGLVWFTWAIPSAILYAIGIPILITANNIKTKEREEALRID